MVRRIGLHRIRQVVVGHASLIHRPGDARGRERIHQLLGDGVPAVLGNLIICKRLAHGVAIGVNGGCGGVENGPESAEIPIAPGRWRQRSKERVAGALARALIIEKEERPVLDDRTAGAESELIQFERWDGVGGGIEVIFRVERAVAQKLVNRPVQCIGARFDRYIQHRTARASKLRAHGIGLHLELGDRVRRRSHDIRRLIHHVLGHAVVVHAIQ